MNRILLAGLAAIPLLTLPADANNAPSGDRVIAFDVLRGGRDLGSHVVRFDHNGDRLEVTTDVDLRVAFGPLTVFNYEHDAVEIWENGELVAFRSQTRKDGEDLTVSAERNGDSWTIDGTDYEGGPLTSTLPLSLALSSHWNGYDVSADTIFNTETGEGMPVEITDLGTETLTVMGDRIEARRIRLSGSLTVDLWYGPDGEWLKCAFEARGEQVVYVRVAG